MSKCGRNEKCPCGSEKKYKRCCLAKDGAARRAHGACGDQVERALRAGYTPVRFDLDGFTIETLTPAAIRKELVTSVIQGGTADRLLQDAGSEWGSSAILLTNAKGEPSEEALEILLGDSKERVDASGVSVRAVVAGSDRVAAAIEQHAPSGAATLRDSVGGPFVVVVFVDGTSVVSLKPLAEAPS